MRSRRINGYTEFENHMILSRPNRGDAPPPVYRLTASPARCMEQDLTNFYGLREIRPSCELLRKWFRERHA